jgi:hypothetical protein
MFIGAALLITGGVSRIARALETASSPVASFLYSWKRDALPPEIRPVYLHAPELLLALESAADQLDTRVPGAGASYRALIAKAKGEA